MSSWLWGSTPDPAAVEAATHNPNFKPVSDTPQDQLFGELTPTDLSWVQAGGFTTETYTWYSILPDGALVSAQIIHSAIGIPFPQIQVTFKLYNPTTGAKIWKSVSVSKFVSPAPKSNDKRTCKSDQLAIDFVTLPNGDEKFVLDITYDAEVQLSWSFVRPAASKGWKIGSGPQGGKSIFGLQPPPTPSAEPDGYVFHAFWPVAKTEGVILANGQVIDGAGQGMFIHAIQGMRPNLVASKWNFANFQSDKVTAIMMEFTTIASYGDPDESSAEKDPANPAATKRHPLAVTIGSVSVGGRLTSVVAATRGRPGKPLMDKTADEHLTAFVQHAKPTPDPDTGYNVPTEIAYHWDGPALSADSTPKALPQNVKADVVVDLKAPYPSIDAPALVDKVDVLAEIPYLVKKIISYAAGLKPYVYQTISKATLTIELPEAVGELPAGASNVEGTLFEEHTYLYE